MSPSPSPFVHLHLHSQYSLLDGAIRLDPLLARAKEFDMEAVAITDHGTMFGAVEFFSKAKKAGIKPIVGCECYVAPRSLADKTPEDAKGLTHLLLLAETQEGYRNLCRLASIAQLEGFYYKPRIDREALRKYSRGLIAASACLHGEIPLHLQKGRMEDAEASARFYLDIFGEDRFFLEVQNNGIPVQETVNEGLADLGKRMGIPLIATNDCHYLRREDARAHEVLLCVQTGKTIHDAGRFQFNTDQLYFKSPDEMQAELGHFPGAIENTRDIARRCEIDFDFDTYHFPQFAAEDERSADDIFEEKVLEGFQVRMAQVRSRFPDADEAVYRERLDYEIGVIKQMGFPGYFLIVADFIRFGKENGVPVGPGRGSAAGSMVAYAMGITDLDPLEHGLIFERFLNPARISMPDIDVDFCINGREKVFKYVVERYGGGDYVAQIITFGKLKTRAVIRDVGRALDIPLAEVDAIAKMVPDVLNISLDDALKQEPRLTEMADRDPRIGELIRIARTLEGLPRHASTHAAGVVIGDRPLVDYLPLYRGKKGEVVTQFDMKWVEQIGLVKFDFLGLRNLTIIQNTLELIARNGKTAPDLETLNLEDPPTYELLSRADTTGVFQLESSGMKDLLARLRPARFDDITALVALYRPGPLESGMVDDFVERKHGRQQVRYPLPELESILEETYGVILYQEQVMKIAGELASYSMAEADGLRKAMGKKIAEIMAQHRERFVQGAVKNGHPEDKATHLFDLMEKFGGYGFNKSHSAAYALIAYQTAYLKAHFPVEFTASLLSSDMSSIDSIVKFMAECRSHDIPVLPPDVNTSGKTFIADGDKIPFGLVAVKNVGEGAIDAILEAREEGGPFASVFDFCERVDPRRVNKRVLEALIKCGAFDGTGASRPRLLAAMEEALDYGARAQRERESPQLGLFDTGEVVQPVNVPILPEVPDWDERQILALEKETLGFYISGHPLGRYEEALDRFANGDAMRLKEMDDGAAVRIGGIVVAVKTIRTKKGDPMAFVTVEDRFGTTEAVVFTSVYRETADLLVEDRAVLVEGKLQRDENAVKILADRIIALEEAETRCAAAVHITVDATRTDREMLERLRGLLGAHRGDCRGYLHIRVPGAAETVIAMAESLPLAPGEPLRREVEGLLGRGCIEIACKPPEYREKPNGRGKYGRAGA